VKWVVTVWSYEIININTMLEDGAKLLLELVLTITSKVSSIVGII
jgi:hypothetical protein